LKIVQTIIDVRETIIDVRETIINVHQTIIKESPNYFFRNLFLREFFILKNEHPSSYTKNPFYQQRRETQNP